MSLFETCMLICLIILILLLAVRRPRSSTLPPQPPDETLYTCPECGSEFELFGKAVDAMRIGKDQPEKPIFCPCCRTPLDNQAYGPSIEAYLCMECKGIVRRMDGQRVRCCPFCGKTDGEWRTISVRKEKARG